MPGKEDIDYKAKCEELSKRNVELVAENKSLTATLDRLKTEFDVQKTEFDNTVAAHNEIRDQTMTALSTLTAQVSNSRFLTWNQLQQQRRQVEQLKTQLKGDEKKK